MRSFVNKKQLKEFVLTRPLLVKLYRWRQFKGIFSRKLSKKIKGKNNTFTKSKNAAIIKSKIDIVGDNNTILIDALCVLNRLTIYVRGSNNTIHLKSGVKFYRYGELWIEDNGCSIVVGDNTTFEHAHIAATEDQSKIVIGNGCMFSTDIEIRTGDSHSILDKQTKARINKAESVSIGNHVWVGANCSILKGAEISDGSIVGTRSVVTKKFGQKDVILAGIPAKIVKEEILWDVNRL